MPERSTKHRRPSAQEMDERVAIPLPPDQAVKAIMETGPHPAEEEKDQPQPER